jgi:PAP2 superfamily protein
MAFIASNPRHQALSEPETRRRASLIREVMVIALAALGYFGVRYLSQGTTDAAIANAQRLLNIEALFSLDLEIDIQAWALARASVVTASNYVYMWLHWPLIVGVLILTYRRWPQTFRRLRNAMIISGLIGLVVFATFPVAPPRLLADGGFVDTITLKASTYRILQPPSLVNEYAALPSFHVGWNVLLVVALRPHLSTVLRRLAWISPALMTAAVVITANHYIIDAAIGAAVAVGAWVAAGYLSSRGRDRAVATVEGARGVPRPPLVSAAATGLPSRPGGDFEPTN